MENNIISKSMQETLEIGNFDFLQNYGEIIIDSALNDGLLKDVPILGTLFGVSKCVRNVTDMLFAKKLIAFLIGIKDANLQDRKEAIIKWEEGSRYRVDVGETLISMINRCDDVLKAQWLSKLYYELVLKRYMSRLFMRAEKILSSLSVMDVLAFLALPDDCYSQLPELECEPYIGSGLYKYAEITPPEDGTLDLDKRVCKISEAGQWIYKILKENS